MNNNQIITSREMLKEKFGRLNLRTDGVENFLTYFIQILQAGQKFEIISKMKVEKISNEIIYSLTQISNKNAMKIANSLYVLTLWLLSMDAWSAFCELTTNSGDTLFLKAKEWLEGKCQKEEFILKCARSNILKLDKEILNKICSFLLEKIKDFKDFLNPKNNLKEEHMNLQIELLIKFGSEYNLLIDKKYSHYLDKLVSTIEAFVNEVTIIGKLNGTNILSGYEQNRSELENYYISSYTNICNYYKNMLENLKVEYKKKIDKCVKFDTWYNSLSDSEQRKVKSEEISKYDEVVITSEYESKRNELLEKWEKEESENEKREVEQRELISKLEIQAEIACPSLAMLIKEYALYAKCCKGEMPYPEKDIEKYIFFTELSLEDAVKEVIEAKDKLNLSDSEVSYLLVYGK